MAINATEQGERNNCWVFFWGGGGGGLFFYVGLHFYLSLPCLFKIVLGGRYNHV